MARQRPAARLLPAFLAAVRKQGTIVAGDLVLAACSGGPDSVALVALLLKLREEMPLEVHLAHFNHRLRDGADEDERFVRDLARRWVLPLVSEGADVRSHAAK
ncbi:MAG: ATP-binding protein, partial [Longimicrobiales bacterium]|nr:ATP-binding protein [Longimicrobiales bacterium]